LQQQQVNLTAYRQEWHELNDRLSSPSYIDYCNYRFGKNGSIGYEGNVVGCYRILDIEKAIEKYSQIKQQLEKYEEFQLNEENNNNNFQKCPYIGSPLGFLEWSAKRDHISEISTICMSVCRGFIIGLRGNSVFNCVSSIPIRMTDLLTIENPEQKHLLTSTKLFLKRPNYVNEIIKSCNKKLQQNGLNSSYISIDSKCFFILDKKTPISSIPKDLTIKIWGWDEGAYRSSLTKERQPNPTDLESFEAKLWPDFLDSSFFEKLKKQKKPLHEN